MPNRSSVKRTPAYARIRRDISARPAESDFKFISIFLLRQGRLLHPDAQSYFLAPFRRLWGKPDSNSGLLRDSLVSPSGLYCTTEPPHRQFMSIWVFIFSHIPILYTVKVVQGKVSFDSQNDKYTSQLSCDASPEAYLSLRLTVKRICHLVIEIWQIRLRWSFTG
jgi:hypothetical protein